MTGVLQGSIGGLLNKGQSILDRFFPPERRNELSAKLSKFATEKPMLAVSHYQHLMLIFTIRFPLIPRSVLYFLPISALFPPSWSLHRPYNHCRRLRSCRSALNRRPRCSRIHRHLCWNWPHHTLTNAVRHHVRRSFHLALGYRRILHCQMVQSERDPRYP